MEFLILRSRKYQIDYGHNKIIDRVPIYLPLHLGDSVYSDFTRMAKARKSQENADLKVYLARTVASGGWTYDGVPPHR